jgi:hypothetical protein
MHPIVDRTLPASRFPRLTPLTDDVELRAYADAYERASGYRVPDAHLRRSTVLGLLVAGRLVGGAVLSGTEPLRTLQRLPSSEQGRIRERLAPRRVVDVSCVWLTAEFRRSAVSGIFWWALLRRIHLTGAEDVLFGTERPGLYRLYLTTHAELLYQGPVTVDGQDVFGWIFLKKNTSPWPVAARMTLHTARRRARRPARRVRAGAATAAGPSR